MIDFPSKSFQKDIKYVQKMTRAPGDFAIQSNVVYYVTGSRIYLPHL